MRFLVYCIFFSMGVLASKVYIANERSLQVQAVIDSKYPVHSTAEKRMLLEHYSKVESAGEPSGLYAASVRHKGTDLDFVYFFDEDSVLTKDYRSNFNSVLGESSLYISGSAKYKRDASTISYSDITGAKKMFDPLGEPLVVNEDGTIDTYFFLVGDKSETIKINLKPKKSIEELGIKGPVAGAGDRVGSRSLFDSYKEYSYIIMSILVMIVLAEILLHFVRIRSLRMLNRVEINRVENFKSIK